MCMSRRPSRAERLQPGWLNSHGVDELRSLEVATASRNRHSSGRESACAGPVRAALPNSGPDRTLIREEAHLRSSENRAAAWHGELCVEHGIS
jgi:hypothetical protein